MFEFAAFMGARPLYGFIVVSASVNHGSRPLFTDWSRKSIWPVNHRSLIYHHFQFICYTKKRIDKNPTLNNALYILYIMNSRFIFFALLFAMLKRSKVKGHLIPAARVSKHPTSSSGDDDVTGRSCEVFTSDFGISHHSHST